jgi:3-oxoacyl-[acyl-carrier protein] reductase
MTASALSPDKYQERKAAIPRGRFAAAEDIAAVIGFLVSEDNTYITGQNIIVDGGESIC